MEGVAIRNKPGEVELQALLAGNDILLHSDDVAEAKALILDAVAQGLISEQEINRRVKKVLKAKYWAGLHSFTPLDTYNIADRLTTSATSEVIEKLYSEAITVAANKGDLLPLRPVRPQQNRQPKHWRFGCGFQRLPQPLHPGRSLSDREGFR